MSSCLVGGVKAGWGILALSLGNWEFLHPSYRGGKIIKWKALCICQLRQKKYVLVETISNILNMEKAIYLFSLAYRKKNIDKFALKEPTRVHMRPYISGRQPFLSLN